MKNNLLKENFTIVINSLLEDNRLSYGAKGLASYLLSKPENWKFYMSVIQKSSTDGKLKIQKYIKELENIGFLKRELIRDNQNKIKGLNYIFNLDYFNKNILTENPPDGKSYSQEIRLTENPPDGKSATTNTNNNNNTNTNNNNNNNTDNNIILHTADLKKTKSAEIKNNSLDNNSNIDCKHGNTEILNENNVNSINNPKKEKELKELNSNNIIRSVVICPSKKNPFIKPTIEEIETYCSTEGININAKQFYYFYESKGWMIGKNKMKDWKSALRTWEIKKYNNNAKLSDAEEFLRLGKEI